MSSGQVQTTWSTSAAAPTHERYRFAALSLEVSRTYPLYERRSTDLTLKMLWRDHTNAILKSGYHGGLESNMASWSFPCEVGKRIKEEDLAVTWAYVIGEICVPPCCDPLMSHTIRRFFFLHLPGFATSCGKSGMGRQQAFCCSDVRKHQDVRLAISTTNCCLLFIDFIES